MGRDLPLNLPSPAKKKKKEGAGAGSPKQKGPVLSDSVLRQYCYKLESTEQIFIR